MTQKICTKDDPFVPPLKDDEQWEHPDQYDKYPDHEFRIVVFHCPHCDLDIYVDIYPYGPSLEEPLMDKEGHTADCCRKKEHNTKWQICEECQTFRAPCKLCLKCLVNKNICPHCKQKVV